MENVEILSRLRREIHQNPEISGEEKDTAARIKRFVSTYHPDEIIDEVGGHGLLCVYNGRAVGPTVMIRAELDGLPIPEKNGQLPYKSNIVGKGHLCGHDGHMTMVAALAMSLSKNRPARGRVVLMFQPAEETGKGAEAVMAHPKFKPYAPDYIFSLHNLPGYPLHEVIIKGNTFAAASKGMIFKLTGKTSHAAEPENGVSPAHAMGEIIHALEALPKQLTKLQAFSLVTIVHARLGKRTFGITPGEAEVMATFRAYLDNDLEMLEQEGVKQVKTIAEKHGLELSIEQDEVFSATVNDEECSALVMMAANTLALPLKQVTSPFRWSEDFGIFTKHYKGAMFGLGSGEDTPDLHNPDYDFPETLMPSGIKMFKQLIDQLLN